jgi:hypothetical protein
MAGADGESVAHGELDEVGLVACSPHEAWPGRLAEGDPEPQVRRAAGKRTEEILDGLDEVGLSEHDVEIVRLVDSNGRKLHD